MMYDNFENVKVGDKIYYTMQYGWSSRRPIVEEVLKVTATEFRTERNRYRKKDGKQIGDRNYVVIYDPQKHDVEFKKFNDMILKNKCIKIISNKCGVLDLVELKEIADKIAEKEKGE